MRGFKRLWHGYAHTVMAARRQQANTPDNVHLPPLTTVAHTHRSIYHATVPGYNMTQAVAKCFAILFRVPPIAATEQTAGAYFVTFTT